MGLRRFAAAALCAAAVLVLPSTASGEGFGTPFDISATGYGAWYYAGNFGGYPHYNYLWEVQAPDVAVNASGAAVAIWMRRDEGGTSRVETSYRPAGGTFGTPRAVGTVRNQDNPLRTEAKIDEQGRTMVLWSGLDASSRYAIRYATALPGRGYSAPASVPGSAPTKRPFAAELAPSGDAVVAWTGDDDVVRAAVRAPGSPFGTAQVLSGTGAKVAYGVHASVLPGGRAAVSWVDDSSGKRAVQTAVRAPGAAFGKPRDVSGPHGWIKAIDQALAGDGRIAVTWLADDSTDGTYTPTARLLLPTGAPAGAPEPLPTAYNPTSVQIAFDGNGTAVAAWGECRKVNSATLCSTSVAERPRYRAFGPPATIAGIPGTEGALDLMTGPGGHVAGLAYRASTGTVKFTRRISGASFSAYTDAPGSPANLPALALDGSGRPTAVWYKWTGDDTALVRGADWDAEPPALTADVPPTAVAGEPVAMKATADDPSGVTIAWRFGDGAAAAGPEVEHAYDAPGRYTVTVKATDGARNTRSLVRQIQVSAPAR